MPERDFEDQLARRLRGYAEGGVRPFDAMQIAHAASRGGGTRTRLRRRRPLETAARWVLVAALLVVGLVAAGIVGGYLPLPTAVVPSPSPTSPATPAATPEVTPTQPGEPTPSPTAEPTSPASPSPEPTTGPTPTAAPTPSPTATPAPSPSPGNVVGAWQQVDFPFGDATHLTGFASGGPGYVAVGWASDGRGGTIGGRAWTSADGRSWTAAPSDPFGGARLLRVVELAAQLYGIGPIPSDDEEEHWLAGRFWVWRSADGVSWQQLPQPSEFAGAVIEDLVVAGGTMVAGGYRDAGGRSHAVVWISSDGQAWREAAQPPELYNVLRLAVGGGAGTLVAIGNDPSSPPWRSPWYSTDGGERWLRGDAPMLADADIDLADIAGSAAGFVAVGKHGDLALTRAFAIASTDGATWQDANTGFATQTMDRVLPVRAGFLAMGALVEVQETPCAPVNCVDAVPVEPRAWLSSDGRTWQPTTPLPAFLDGFSAVHPGPTGVLITNYAFEGGVWFAPYE